jgi:hypothetical protein
MESRNNLWGCLYVNTTRVLRVPGLEGQGSTEYPPLMAFQFPESSYTSSSVSTVAQHLSSSIRTESKAKNYIIKDASVRMASPPLHSLAVDFQLGPSRLASRLPRPLSLPFSPISSPRLSSLASSPRLLASPLPPPLNTLRLRKSPASTTAINRPPSLPTLRRRSSPSRPIGMPWT